MKPILTILILLSVILNTEAQNCSCISKSKNKKQGTESLGGMVSSKDFFTLLINKTIATKDGTNDLQYSLLLHAASRVILSDSMINATGQFELTLTDGSTVKWDGAHSYNDPLGFGNSIGFSIHLSKAQIEVVSKTPIVSMTIFGILTTEFSKANQKEQIRIVNCLLKD